MKDYFYCQLCGEKFPHPDPMIGLHLLRSHLILVHNIPKEKHMSVKH
jgi:hypothetical protein